MLARNDGIQSMTILAIDTSTDYLSLAIMRGEKIVARFHRKLRMRHSSMLVPTIDRLLKKSRVKLESIDCFAISIGPGSFTGLRIGAVTVKGLSYALNKPIVAVPTLDVIAQNVKGFIGIICPVLDARKNKVYACLYKSDGKNINKISKYLLLSAEELMKKTAGYGKKVFLGDVIGLKSWYPKAEVVANLGAEYYRAKKFVTAEKLEPLYLYSRECDIIGK